MCMTWPFRNGGAVCVSVGSVGKGTAGRSAPLRLCERRHLIAETRAT
ncbi:MAG: hypothetical protein II525_03625 [Bacteroidales bacterium]|nr:hypothetical protein [Bacteroidales bacterium]